MLIQPLPLSPAGMIVVSAMQVMATTAVPKFHNRFHPKRPKQFVVLVTRCLPVAELPMAFEFKSQDFWLQRLMASV